MKTTYQIREIMRKTENPNWRNGIIQPSTGHPISQDQQCTMEKLWLTKLKRITRNRLSLQDPSKFPTIARATLLMSLCSALFPKVNSTSTEVLFTPWSSLTLWISHLTFISTRLSKTCQWWSKNTHQWLPKSKSSSMVQISSVRRWITFRRWISLRQESPSL